MKSYRHGDASTHDYVVRYITRETIGWVNRVDIEDTTLELDDIIPAYTVGKGKNDPVTEIISISVDGKKLSKNEVDRWNKKIAGKLDECDGGGAAGGDAGGAAASAGGDAGVATGDAAIEANSGDDAAGITSAEVLGNCNHRIDGYLGPGCFHIPSRAKVPFTRWSGCAYGGSKRKKDKNGKPKKTPYEKGMKTVVQMFEDENVEQAKVDKKNIFSKLKSISKTIKSMDDVKAIEAKINRDKGKIENKLSGSTYAKAKEMFIDLYEFIKDICTGEHKASWFAITVVAAVLLYVLLPVDVIPDAIPVVGVIDDAFVLKLVYDAIKDELNAWKAQKKYNNVVESDGKKWLYFEELTNGDDGPESYDYKSYISIPELKEKVTTHLDGSEVFYDELDEDDALVALWEKDDVVANGGFMKEFSLKDAAMKYAYSRIDDKCLAYENDTRVYASEEAWEEDKQRIANEREEAIASLERSGIATMTDGRYVIWMCQVVEA